MGGAVCEAGTMGGAICVYRLPVADLGDMSWVHRKLVDLREQKNRQAGGPEVRPQGRSWLLAGSMGETLALSLPSPHTIRIIPMWTPQGALPMEPLQGWHPGCSIGLLLVASQTPSSLGLAVTGNCLLPTGSSWPVTH